MNKKWTLHVENFAKIKSADVTIAPLMCFVGDNNSGKSYLMSILWGILTLGKDIFPKKPSEARVYKQCEDWLKAHINTEIELSENDMELYINWFNELLNTQKKSLVRKIFNYDVEVEKLKITNYERTKPIKIVWEKSGSRYSVTNNYIKFPEVDLPNRDELLRMNVYLLEFINGGYCCSTIYTNCKGKKNWRANLSSGFENRLYAYILAAD